MEEKRVLNNEESEFNGGFIMPTANTFGQNFRSFFCFQSSFTVNFIVNINSKIFPFNYSVLLINID